MEQLPSFPVSAHSIGLSNWSRTGLCRARHRRRQDHRPKLIGKLGNTNTIVTGLTVQAAVTRSLPSVATMVRIRP